MDTGFSFLWTLVSVSTRYGHWCPQIVTDSFFESAIIEMARDTPCICDTGTQSDFFWCPCSAGKETRDEVRYGHHPWTSMVMTIEAHSPSVSWTQTVNKRTPLISGPSVYEVSDHFSGPWDIRGEGGEGCWSHGREHQRWRKGGPG